LFFEDTITSLLNKRELFSVLLFPHFTAAPHVLALRHPFLDLIQRLAKIINLSKAH
jgi:hypothetical protein